MTPTPEHRAKLSAAMKRICAERVWSRKRGDRGVSAVTRSPRAATQSIPRQQNIYRSDGRLTPEYMTWLNIRTRCKNPRHISYPFYGGRGITVCSEWDDFQTFLRDMGTRPEGRYPSGYPKYTIERRNNDGRYDKDNCCWATKEEQNRNKRRGVR